MTQWVRGPKSGFQHPHKKPHITTHVHLEPQLRSVGVGDRKMSQFQSWENKAKSGEQDLHSWLGRKAHTFNSTIWEAEKAYLEANLHSEFSWPSEQPARAMKRRYPVSKKKRRRRRKRILLWATYEPASTPTCTLITIHIHACQKWKKIQWQVPIILASED